MVSKRQFKDIIVSQLWTVATGFLLILAASGCDNRFPQSKVLGAIDPKTILLSLSASNATQQLKYSTDTRPEYSVKQCQAVLPLAADEQRRFLQDFMNQCTNRIRENGGAIIGGGWTDSLDNQEVGYETDRTAGQVSLYATELSKSQVKIIAIVFECRKKRL